MDKKLIVARYDDKDKLRLRMVGPISREVIDNIFLPRNPDTWCAEEDEGYGEVSLLVESENECSGLVKKLNNDLKEKGYKDYNLEYRGPVAVPPERLSILKISDYDLYKLVINTMIAESKGEIKQEELKQLDYQKILEKLTE